ncbi:MAG: hypothetical protein JXA30_02780 [Deltaproteobacteria bacterium]|nr:hypothetical protein [Deltaproteobacteria bacterium]
MCTKSCESDENCQKIANKAVCITSDIHVESGQCATEKQHSESVCDIQCKKDSDCRDFNKTFQCLSGFCRDKEAATSEYADASRPIEEEGDDATTEVEPNPSSSLSASGDLIDCFLPADADYIPPRPEACSEGFVDFDCDGEMVSCPEGRRISVSLDSACRVCVPAADIPCDSARSEYYRVIGQLTRSSCADYCDSDSDCYSYQLKTACDQNCGISLFGGIDEEILWAVEQFHNDWCHVCGDQPFEEISLAPSGACINNRCVLGAK